MAAAILESMARALILTIIFESAFALICRVRVRRNYLVIFLVNLLTNPFVNAFYRIAADKTGGVTLAAVTLLLEISAVIAEGLIYKNMTDIKKPMLFSLGANTFSFGLGLITVFIF